MPALQFKVGGTLTWVDESKAGVFVTVKYENFTIKFKGDQMAYVLPADKVVQMQVSYVDANNNPASVDGDVTWDSSDEEIAAVVVNPMDSTICRIEPGNKIGNVQISATADADLGDGTREIVTLGDITVVGGEAVAGTIAPVGEPISPIAQPK